MFSCKRTFSAFRKKSQFEASRADYLFRLTTTLSTSKGEDYEKAQSNRVDGSGCTRTNRNGEGSTYRMLPFG
jgi:hypothetical protein